MPTTFDGAHPVEIEESSNGLVCIKQLSDAGEEQTVSLSLTQAEHVANWCIQYAQSATEDLMEE